MNRRALFLTVLGLGMMGVWLWCVSERVRLACAELDPYRIDLVIGMYVCGLLGVMLLSYGIDRLWDDDNRL